jgi:hypothetical protein
MLPVSSSSELCPAFLVRALLTFSFSKAARSHFSKKETLLIYSFLQARYLCTVRTVHFRVNANMLLGICGVDG